MSKTVTITDDSERLAYLAQMLDFAANQFAIKGWNISAANARSWSDRINREIENA